MQFLSNSPIAEPTAVMQAVLGDVRLELYGATAGATLWADVWGLLLVGSLV